MDAFGWLREVTNEHLLRKPVPPPDYTQLMKTNPNELIFLDIPEMKRKVGKDGKLEKEIHPAKQFVELLSKL